MCHEGIRIAIEPAVFRAKELRQERMNRYYEIDKNRALQFQANQSDLVLYKRRGVFTTITPIRNIHTGVHELMRIVEQEKAGETDLANAPDAGMRT